ncbi:MAG: endonuclease/exonuclease/phosphatase family protein [Archangium sp.]
MFRVTLVVASCVFVACAPRPSEPDAGEPEVPERIRVRAATFNTERFFDTVCQSGSCASGDYEELPTQAAFEARVSQVAIAMNGFGADLISLQEIETQAVVDSLLPRVSTSTPYAVLGEIGGAATVDVAVFSKWPIERVVKHRDEVLIKPDGSRTSFSRELLEVHVTIEGKRVIFFSAHFRSKNNDDPGRRLAEAQATRRIMDAVAVQNPDALIILGGGLNDTPGSEPIVALEENGLLRAAADLPVADQGTYVYGGQSQAIDHLFQAGTQAAALVPRSARVWKQGSRGFAGSDHRALTADWEFEP